MAQRKTAPRRTAKKSPARTGRVSVSMVFWVLFFIVLISLFFILLPMAKKGITLPQRQTVTEQPAVQEPLAEESPAQEQKPPAQEKRTQPKPAAEKPATKPPAKPETKPLEQRQPPEQRPPPAAQEKPPAEKPPAKPPETQTRDRTVYFMREGNGGDLTLAKTTRKLAVSDSPLIDCVNALLAGPTAAEKNRGMINFIPPNTRLLSARVVNNTVHLNFNEEFRYNTFGREGCEAQLRQIVWTATEFPNVNNVQIEIDGKIVDFLIEGIAIRNPIGR